MSLALYLDQKSDFQTSEKSDGSHFSGSHADLVSRTAAVFVCLLMLGGVVYLLAPKPEPQNARAQTVDAAWKTEVRQNH
jgi:predicted phage tail protein